MKQFLNARGFRILDALDAVAARRGATPAQISLAWLMQRPGVTAPIASATSMAQLEELLKVPSIALAAEDIAALDKASE